MTVPSDFTLSHFVSQARPRQWNMQLPRLLNGMSGRVEGQYTTLIIKMTNFVLITKMPNIVPITETNNIALIAKINDIAPITRIPNIVQNTETTNIAPIT